MCVHEYLYTHLVLKTLRCEPCLSNTFSEFLYAHTLLHFRCRMSELIKITMVSKSRVFLCLSAQASFTSKGATCTGEVAVRTHNTLKARKLFVVGVFAYKGPSNHLCVLTEKGLTNAWITHEVTVPCSPPSPLQRWLSLKATPDDLFASTHQTLSHYSELFNNPTVVESNEAYKSQKVLFIQPLAYQNQSGLQH